MKRMQVVFIRRKSLPDQFCVLKIALHCKLLALEKVAEKFVIAPPFHPKCCLCKRAANEIMLLGTPEKRHSTECYLEMRP